MKFSVAAVVAFAAAVYAKIEIGNTVVNPSAGSSFELTWSQAEGPVTIELVYGASTDLKKDQVLASGLDPESGSYTWEVPEDLVARGDYAFYITDGSTENWSLQFALTGTGVASTSAAPTSSAAPSTTAAPSSASTEEASSTLTTVTTEESSSVESSSTRTSSERETQTTAAASASSTGTVPDSKAGTLGSPVALILTLAAMMLYFQ
ncbi:Ser-Thr-rich glycosyl-phosphatidyl-inositol-anchored membrane family-domain-containing protein [Plectosphaerella plurivora]|uniref:Ser-Thr-rich glycosyl-phosphatidyl-inositol-anchored membrane family-domain-containing protein n=1 Tax=Plectosphaerella plurivora TaxID=936078 RepID=A0A9P8VHD6_9PEZI|nr:Ser-Thr-rich glycosyl-phosphatidyl-inositol-anchored membrane family-domain-containing protein [Plectosphaerella plurivora]